MLYGCVSVFVVDWRVCLSLCCCWYLYVCCCFLFIVLFLIIYFCLLFCLCDSLHVIFPLSCIVWSAFRFVVFFCRLFFVLLASPVIRPLSPFYFDHFFILFLSTASSSYFLISFFNDTAISASPTLALHVSLPILPPRRLDYQAIAYSIFCLAASPRSS